jgi:hypothetical protein
MRTLGTEVARGRWGRSATGRSRTESLAVADVAVLVCCTRLRPGRHAAWPARRRQQPHHPRLREGKRSRPGTWATPGLATRFSGGRSARRHPAWLPYVRHPLRRADRLGRLLRRAPTSSRLTSTPIHSPQPWTAYQPAQAQPQSRTPAAAAGGPPSGRERQFTGRSSESAHHTALRFRASFCTAEGALPTCGCIATCDRSNATLQLFYGNI